jgi:AhpD family alkylhydroperoxidase
VIHALQTLGTFAKKADNGSLPVELVVMRASQINGCSVCVQLHGSALKKAGETDERIWAIAAWREAAYFNDAERAALRRATAGDVGPRHRHHQPLQPSTPPHARWPARSREGTTHD